MPFNRQVVDASPEGSHSAEKSEKSASGRKSLLMRQ